MYALSEPDVLAVWERGRSLYPLDRCLLAIHVALPQMQRDGIADWPLGRRNHVLLQLRSSALGPALRGWVACHACPERLEFELDVEALLSRPYPDSVEPITVDGRTFRLPTSRDLAHAAVEDDSERAALALARRCQIGDGPECRAENLEAVGERMALADPLAEITLHFDCPACGASFDESVDVPIFVCADLEAQAKRLLRDIHTLASAYGWSEAEILSLRASRRASYVEMVHA